MNEESSMKTARGNGVFDSLSYAAGYCWEWGADVYLLNRHRRVAAEIARMASRLAGETPEDDLIPSLRRSLPRALEHLTVAFEAAQADAGRPCVSWPAAGAPAEALAQDAAESGAPPEPKVAPAAAPIPNLTASVYMGAIDLADWIQRAGEDERIAPAQGLAVAGRKTSVLMSRLELVKLEATGGFDSDTQEIVDVIETADPEQDQTIAATVSPGYSLAGKLIRPQKVQIYRRAADSQTVTTHE